MVQKLIPRLRITDPLYAWELTPGNLLNIRTITAGPLDLCMVMSLNPDNDLGSSDQAFAAVLASNAIGDSQYIVTTH